MHEQSETDQTRRKGRWVNLYGHTDYPLPQVFPWEERSYETEPIASNRAAWRSRMTDEHNPDYPMQSPSYGFGPIAQQLMRTQRRR
jgi:hypothetical protein